MPAKWASSPARSSPSLSPRIVLWFIQPIGPLIHLGGSLFLSCTRDRLVSGTVPHRPAALVPSRSLPSAIPFPLAEWLVSGTSILRDANFWLEIAAMAIIGAVTVALWVKDFVRLFILPAKYSLDLYVPPLTKELAKHTMVRQQSRFNTLRAVERLRGTSTVTIQPGEALLMEDGQAAGATAAA
ncbi:hypothetical protein PAPYR_44 [Paratrimastix pyriformis]|uniref:Uncharacterized protein n=1 Tax=Paratrimastix pyriformis TaxID=342808 RepID=A0ABQ8UVE8_9EUKA|nr:hypothetical protein PAPYR_44 [Paratrimastix pyriformis]